MSFCSRWPILKFSVVVTAFISNPGPLDKVGVYAVREDPVLFHDLLAALDGGRIRRFEPAGDYLLTFNPGDGRAIFWKKQFAVNLRLAFWLKDYVDRRFMRKFRISSELEEP
jgi:hypothetical protein